ncbi:thrombospondin type 3 repeat-containing protein [Colwellia sp. Arc7-D]|uniref:thrombospondin type 3 repeat-containing protein n=1 Tax=Colwellia sp. Arc7-D TaxID=2161872 RepID=UPI000D37049C|nr:thrombospondin type 3 repeat-containing protein [Colwellia sp. Arc7-D]AWB57845.1 hypothetical protein DBO93_09860 [Colwellia sp. Arc7-D]
MNGPRFYFQVVVIISGILGLTACGGSGSEKKKDPLPEPVIVESIYSEEVNNYYSLDPYTDDTDSDGLKDDYEITYSNEHMSPSLADTDKNGISDANEDNDQDGLTNLHEQELATSPFSHDTDSDGLTDKEEITLKTDPLKVTVMKTDF